MQLRSLVLLLSSLLGHALTAEAVTISLRSGAQTTVYPQRDTSFTVDVYLSGWSPALLRGYQATLEPSSLLGSGQYAPLELDAVNSLIDDRRADFALHDPSRPPYQILADTVGDDSRFVAALENAQDALSDDGEVYLATIAVNVPADAWGTYVLALDPARTYLRSGGPDDPLPATGTVTLMPLTVTIACNSVADCADLDNDGIRDDPCTWWACEGSVCLPTPMSTHADHGGPYGSCPVDDACDGNDRFHALNCFSNTTTMGAPDYPCEDNPPSAYNVDSAGSKGSCAPDGVCDGNDAFQAINCFSGTSLCPDPCSPSPSDPDGPPDPVVTETVSILFLASEPVIQSGTLVTVDVMLLTDVEDIRGYQLHLNIDGGTGGQLSVGDMAVEGGRDDYVFHGLDDWKAFNINLMQLIAGIDDPGVPASGEDGDPGGISLISGYLATLTLQASEDAEGAFTIGLLHNDDEEQHRTFPFPTPSNGLIAINNAQPAVITVEPAPTPEGPPDARPRRPRMRS